MNVLVSRVVRETCCVSVATEDITYAKEVAARRVDHLPRKCWTRSVGSPLFDPFQDQDVPNEEVSTGEN